MNEKSGDACMEFHSEKVWINVRKSTTQDLLNRVTVYRSGMEPEAVVIIEKELQSRGVSLDDIDRYTARMREVVILHEDGTAAKCIFCYEPAIAEAFGWHRLWGVVPLFPRRLRYCREHCPKALAPAEPEAPAEPSPVTTPQTPATESETTSPQD
jgi:hypothetical protein